jgi:hypothetical protein
MSRQRTPEGARRVNAALQVLGFARRQFSANRVSAPLPILISSGISQAQGVAQKTRHYDPCFAQLKSPRNAALPVSRSVS